MDNVESGDEDVRKNLGAIPSAKAVNPHQQQQQQQQQHPWSATTVGNPIPATIPVDQYQKETTNKLLITATIAVDR